jgi:hypothetical protein
MTLIICPFSPKVIYPPSTSFSPVELAGLLDELDHVNTIRTNKRKPPIKEYQSCIFLALAIQAELRVYVNEKLEINKALMTPKVWSTPT